MATVVSIRIVAGEFDYRKNLQNKQVEQNNVRSSHSPEFQQWPVMLMTHKYLEYCFWMSLMKTKYNNVVPLRIFSFSFKTQREADSAFLLLFKSHVQPGICGPLKDFALIYMCPEQICGF